MANYLKATNFAAKDSLPSGDPAKKIRGSEINDEFNAIQAAISTKIDGNSPAFTGVPTAPLASIGADNTQIATTEWVRDIINAIEPIGTIKAFAGTISNIPSGWAVCDGTSNTLNLTDRFIAAYGPGGFFGQNGTDGHTPGSGFTPVTGNTVSNGVHAHGSVTGDHALTIDQIPSHTHTITSFNEQQQLGSNPATTGGLISTGPMVTNATGGGQIHNHGILSDGDHFHSLTGAEAQVPGFFVLMFIQKIANI